MWLVCQAFDFGRRENLRRYGSRSPPAYAPAYARLDLHLHFVGGSDDRLVPGDDIHDMVAEINAAAPGTASAMVFAGLGHLDFTLGTNDEVGRAGGGGMARHRGTDADARRTSR